MVRPVHGLVKSIQPAACWCSLFAFYVKFGRQARNICGMICGGSFSMFGFFPGCLSEEVQPVSVLPLWALHAYPMCWHPIFLNAVGCGPHQSDGNHIIDVSIRPRVGLMSLGLEVDIYTFQGSPRLHSQ